MRKKVKGGKGGEKKVVAGKKKKHSLVPPIKNHQVAGLEGRGSTKQKKQKRQKKGNSCWVEGGSFVQGVPTRKKVGANLKEKGGGILRLAKN